MKYDIFDSPIGKLTIATNGASITALHIEGDRYFTNIPADWTQDKNVPLLLQAKTELAEYFAGKRQAFDIPLDIIGTPFQVQVWQTLQKIPAGSTVTYGEIARKIGKPKAVRAVGTAIGRNQICIIVPCHRVLTSNGTPGGYVAGEERKKALLQREGALS